MSSHGQVTVWKMTEEQRLAYIKKHPIKPVEKPTGTNFSNIDTYGERSKKRAAQQPKIMDKVDKEELHKRFMAGEKLEDIAKAFDITISTLDNFILSQRKINPEKWPRRVVRKKGK